MEADKKCMPLFLVCFSLVALFAQVSAEASKYKTGDHVNLKKQTRIIRLNNQNNHLMLKRWRFLSTKSVPTGIR